MAPRLHVVPRSRMRVVIPTFPQYAFMAWCSVKAQGDNFTFCIQSFIQYFCLKVKFTGRKNIGNHQCGFDVIDEPLIIRLWGKVEVKWNSTSVTCRF